MLIWRIIVADGFGTVARWAARVATRLVCGADRVAWPAVRFALPWNRPSMGAGRFVAVPAPAAEAVRRFLNGYTYPYYKNPVP